MTGELHSTHEAKNVGTVPAYACQSPLCPSVRVKFRIHLYELTRSTCLPLPTPLAVPTAAAFSVMQAGQFLPHLHRSVSIGRQANDSGALQSTADEVAYAARVTAAECADAVGFGQALGRGAYEWPAKRWPVSPISAI